MNLRKVLAVAAITGAALTAGAYGVQTAKAADTESQFPPMVQRLVEKFNLNKDEVKVEMDKMRSERQGEREAEFTKKLDELVTAGKITAEQKNQILAKHEEMQAKREALKSLSPEERKTKMEELRTEMQNFYKSIGVDESLVKPAKPQGPRGGGMGGMHRNW